MRIDWADEIGGVVVELSKEIDLKGLSFDPSALVSLPYTLQGECSIYLRLSYTQSGIGSMVILTQPAPQDSEQDIFSRVFAPDIGVNEDPVVSLSSS